MQNMSAMARVQQRNLCLILVSFFFTSSSSVAGYRMRLTGSGSNRCSGRVEIFYNGTWGTVCDDEWGLTAAKVVCRQLNCGAALNALTEAFFGEGKGPILLDDVVCSGSERFLTECDHSGFGIHDCENDEDAGVICSKSLMKPKIAMNPVGEITLNQSVNITCSVSIKVVAGLFILRKTPGHYKSTRSQNSNSATFNIPRMDYSKEGSYLCQYKRTVSDVEYFSPRSDSITLFITVQLQQPSITLTTPNRELVWSPEGAAVTRGYSFVFLCSTNCSYPEGRFFLISSSSNITLNKPAVNHSASFHFPVAEYYHKGNYSCVYEVKRTMQSINSTQTAPISIVITLPLYPLQLVSSAAAGILLLLLVVLVVVCLVCMRRQQAKQPGTLVQTQLAVRMESHLKDDGEDYVNVGPVYAKKNLKEETGRLEDENIYEDPESFNLHSEEAESNLKKAKEVYFRQEEAENPSDVDDDYDIVIQPSTETTMDGYGNQEGIYLTF